jgi:RNA recognition motif-containing protein
LFVGNLPFNVIDQDLLNIFADFKVETAHVVRMFNGASRGFGFVTLSSEAEQQKALNGLPEVLCDGRKLIIRPALSDEGRKNEKAHEVVIKGDN